MFDHVAANASHIAALAKSIETSPIPMAVVSYVGRHDADGLVTDGNNDKGEYLSRMYGTRDMRHVSIYKLEGLEYNAAARAMLDEGM
jgi:hypothetical protein